VLVEANGRFSLFFAEKNFFSLGAVCHAVFTVESADLALAVRICFDLTIGSPFFEEKVAIGAGRRRSKPTIPDGR